MLHSHMVKVKSMDTKIGSSVQATWIKELLRRMVLLTKYNLSVSTDSNFPLAPMGVLAPGSAHARPSARPPIDTSGNFSVHMSGGGKLSDSFADQLSRQIREF